MSNVIRLPITKLVHFQYHPTLHSVACSNPSPNLDVTNVANEVTCQTCRREILEYQKRIRDIPWYYGIPWYGMFALLAYGLYKLFISI